MSLLSGLLRQFFFRRSSGSGEVGKWSITQEAVGLTSTGLLKNQGFFFTSTYEHVPGIQSHVLRTFIFCPISFINVADSTTAHSHIRTRSWIMFFRFGSDVGSFEECFHLSQCPAATNKKQDKSRSIVQQYFYLYWGETN